MTAALEAAEERFGYGNGGFPEEDEYRKHLHGLTHSGVEQLSDRLDDGLLLAPNYPEPKVVLLLLDATKCAILSGFLLLRATQRDLNEVELVSKAFLDFQERAFR